MNTSGLSSAEPRAYFSALGRIRMLAGDPALDFANTLHWRGAQQMDFLPDYQALAEWSVPAGLLSEQEMDMLVLLAPRFPRAAEAAHSAAIALRSAWRAWLEERTGGGLNPQTRSPSFPLLEPLLTSALSDPGLLMSAGERREDDERMLVLPLSRIALAVASLALIPAERAMGRCEGDPCGGFFLNTSRSKPRRWCSMDSCGNRAKARGFRSRMMAEEIRKPGD
ncbi:MAG: CGNR zinc finger domain-containing protein [Rhizobium sp.]|nr:CGNR zinc finger domain-containing protein [Rhizobium sp.]